MFRPKTTKETVPAPKRHPEVSRDRRRRARNAPSFSVLDQLKRVRYLRQAVDLANFLRYFFSAETLVSCLFFGTSTARGRSKLEHHDVILRF